MKDETKTWLDYAVENLDVAKLTLAHNHFNPSLQNAQQVEEKALKAIIIQTAAIFKKTHSINELAAIIDELGIEVQITEDGCDLRSFKIPGGKCLC